MSAKVVSEVVVVDTPDGVQVKPSWFASVAFRKRPVNSRWADFEWDTASISVSDDLRVVPAGPLHGELAEILPHACERPLIEEAG